MCTGDMFPFLGKSSNHDIKIRAQFQSFSKELKITRGMKPFEASREFYRFYRELFKHCKLCQIFLLPWELHHPDNNTDIGFVCDNFTTDTNAHLPIKYRANIMDWSTQIYNVLNKDKILPGFIKDGLLSYKNQGYEFLQTQIVDYHPRFMAVPTTVRPSHPTQGLYDSFDKYSGNFLYYQQQEAFVKDVEIKLDNHQVQDIFILNMKETAIPKLQEIIEKERNCQLSTKKG